VCRYFAFAVNDGIVDVVAYENVDRLRDPMRRCHTMGLHGSPSRATA
jgi:hypothetical protein